ncbi:MAG: hypothetical protein Q8Q39_01450 [bacterium]|nr:hypothetical protein [bacterium]
MTTLSSRADAVLRKGVAIWQSEKIASSFLLAMTERVNRNTH